VEPPLVAPLGQWTHLALTLGNNRRRLYVNGYLADALEVLGVVPTGTVPLTIGSRYNDSEWFRGAVDHVAVYNGELDQTTVKRHYRAFRRATGNPLGSSELLAWQSYCQSLFCRTEFMYVE